MSCIISAPNSGPILVFFFSPEGYFLYLPGPCFNMQMWPVFVVQFQSAFLSFDAEGEGEGVSLILYPFLGQFGHYYMHCKAMNQGF